MESNYKNEFWINVYPAITFLRVIWKPNWKEKFPAYPFFIYYSDDQIKENVMSIGYVLRMGQRKGASRVSVGEPEGRARLEDTGGMVILKWILKE
jgi:hypothetical protein